MDDFRKTAADPVTARQDGKRAKPGYVISTAVCHDGVSLYVYADGELAAMDADDAGWKPRG